MARWELAGFIFTIDCTLRASARHLASAGCRGAARGELAGFIFTIDCTLRASARHLASAGCRGAVRWELAGSICTIGCTLRASAQHPTWQAPVARPAHSPLPPALTYGCSSSPPHPILLLPHTPFSISPHPSLPPPLASFSGTPPHTAHTHAPWSLLRRRPSSARPWYPPTLSDTINQAPPS